jgi:hypothetical protein
MEDKVMKFNSQICTTQEQSERLLALGLKKETADCRICPLIVNPNKYFIMDMGIQPLDDDETPAWSLHRLINLCGINRLPISLHEKGKMRIRVNHIHPTHDGRSGYNHYDSLIDCIEWLIKEGYFYKEYLEEK